LTAVNGVLFFRDYNPDTARSELWRSDGTAAGTVVVRDFGVPNAGLYPELLAPVGGTLYFVAWDPTHGGELWRTDGTAAGTTLVKDIRGGDAGSTPQHPLAVGGTLYFVADDGQNGYEVWASDGTPAGTVRLTDRPDFEVTGERLAARGTELLFTGTDWQSGPELWKVSRFPAPALVGVRVNGTTAPSAGFTASRLTSLVLTFNTPVAVDVGAFALSNGTFTLSNTAGGGIGVSVSGGTVTLTFTGTVGVEFGSLRDGIWTLTTDLTKVRNVAGTAGTGAATTQHVRRLYGDWSGDGAVTLEDYERFGAGFGTSSGDSGWASDQVFDFNADGTLTLEDYEPFGARFGSSL
jgi:ELWxxDGT repeat protein